MSLRSRILSRDRKSTRLNSSHGYISYAVFCLKKKNKSIGNPSPSPSTFPSTDSSHSPLPRPCVQLQPPPVPTPRAGTLSSDCLSDALVHGSVLDERVRPRRRVSQL